MNAREGRRCAVVYNPTKISDRFRKLLTNVLDRDGWVATLWLETTVDDPGRGMVAEAVAAGVDLVVGAGGDGTIRMVADGLAGTGIPMGLVPAGTANLLARNLDVPLHEETAIEVALTGNSRTIDLIKITVDEREAEHFAVIAGVGVDAMIMDEVNDDLKAKVGSAAYFIAAGKALGRLPVDLTVRWMTAARSDVTPCCAPSGTSQTSKATSPSFPALPRTTVCSTSTSPRRTGYGTGCSWLCG